MAAIELVRKSLLTTKGDLFVFDGTDLVRVGVGTDGQVLTADAAEASGVKWAAGGGGGGGTFSGASVYRSSTDQTVSVTTATAVQFNGEDEDTDTYHDNTTNNTRLTVPATGRYRVEGVVSLTGLDDASTLIYLAVNGTAAKHVYRDESPDSSNITTSWSTKLDLTVSDYVELFVQQAVGASYNIRAGREFTSVQIEQVG